MTSASLSESESLSPCCAGVQVMIGIDKVGDGDRAESVGEEGESDREREVDRSLARGVANTGRTGVGAARAEGGGTDGVADGGVMVNDGFSP
jgi:hypothetical protein